MAIKSASGASTRLPGFLQVTRIHLDFADQGQRNTSLGPSFIEPHLGFGRVPSPVPERIGHGRFYQTVFQDHPTRQFQALSDDSFGRRKGFNVHHILISRYFDFQIYRFTTNPETGRA